MPEHKHAGGEEKRIQWDRITLRDVVDEIIEFVEARELEEETEESE
jgi:hypothetical protein